MKKTKLFLLSSSAIALTSMALPVISGCSCQVKVKYRADKNFKYELLDDGTYQVIECTNVTDVITVPSKIDNFDVTAVGTKFLFNNSTVKTVILPTSIKKIGFSAFMNCYNLSAINFEGTNDSPKLEEIESHAFEGCHNLSVIELPTSLKTIGSFAFQYCPSLGTIYIPNNVETIEIDAFNGCSNAIFLIQASSIPSTWNAKWNSSNRPYITECDSETRLFDFTNSDEVVYKCFAGANDQAYLISATNLANHSKRLDIPSTVTKKIFNEETKVWSEKTYTVSNIISGCFSEKAASVTSVVVPSGIKLNEKCFSGLICASVYTSGKLDSDWVKTFEESSNGCKVYQNITLEGSYSSEQWRFQYIVVNNQAIITGCADNETNLNISATVVTPEKTYPVVEIAPRAFIRHPNLSTVLFPETTDNTIKINDYAFYDCRNLGEVDIDNVSSIGKYAFAVSALRDLTHNGVTLLKTTSINTNKLKTIGQNAFEKPYKIALDKYTEITTNIFDEGNTITSIGMECFKNVVFANNSKFYLNNNLTALSAREFNKAGYDANGGKTYITEFAVSQTLFNTMKNKWGWNLELVQGQTYYLLKGKTNLGIGHIVIE